MREYYVTLASAISIIEKLPAIDKIFIRDWLNKIPFSYEDGVVKDTYEEE